MAPRPTSEIFIKVKIRQCKKLFKNPVVQFTIFTLLSVAVAVTIVCLTIPKTTRTCQRIFKPTAPKSIRPDSRPTSITVGHLNNDTQLDIAVANSGTDNVGIFFGYSNGGFTDQNTYHTGSGSQPSSIVGGDFNNDSWLDIAVANYGTNSIGVLLSNGNGTFTAPNVFILESSRPVSINTADLNNDDKLDIVVANPDTSDIAIFFGYGNGSFVSPIRLTTGFDSLPRSIAFGDFNNDSRLDIVVANSGTNNVGIFMGFGNGSFSTQKIFTTGNSSTPYFVAVDDLNDDHQLDLAVANYGTDCIGILYGHANGTFSTVREISMGSGSGPYSLAIGDLYNDNQTDIAVSNSKSDTIIILRGLGNETFVSTENHVPDTESSLLSIITGDFDNDNRLDIAVINNGTNNIAVVLRRIRDPFGDQTLYATGSETFPFNVAAGDLNNDNQLDIVVANGEGDNVAVLLGYGNGSFKEKMTFTTGIDSVSYSVALGDFNKDKHLDVAVANWRTNNVGVLLGLGNGSLSPQISYSTGNESHSHSVDVGDFNNDNQLDIVVANWGTDNIGVLLGHGDGTFAKPLMYSAGAHSSPIMVATGHLNDDNFLDVAVVNLTLDSIGVLLGYGNGSFRNLTTYSNDCSPRSIVIYDFNNDNILDIAIANTQCDSVGILLGYGDGKFSDELTYSAGSVTNTYWLGVADFNRDNQLDIVAVNFDSSDLSILFGVGNGSFLFETQYSIGASSRPSSVAVGDFNNDGLSDIVVSHYYNQNIGVFLGSDDAQDAIQTIYSTGSSAHPHSVLVTDLNNDTKLDLVIANSGHNNVSVRLGYSNGTFSAETLYTIDSNFVPEYVTAGDFNKDGRVDIVVANTLNDSIGILFGQENDTFGNSQIYTTGHGSQPYWITTADFNNDSRPDLAVANSGTNTVGIFLGYDTVRFHRQKPASCGLGVGPQFFVVNDFNNDTRLDIAVADYNNHDVGIHLGYGDGTFAPQKIYVTTDDLWPCFIATSDFNGDRKLDLVVANCYSDNIGILYGYGNGTFTNQYLYFIENGSIPVSVAIGDVNTDEQLDILVANGGTNSVTILFGYGNGTFSIETTYSTGVGSNPMFVALNDLNRDNHLDIVVANYGADNIGIFYGYGNGNFSTQTIYSTGDGSFPYNFAVGDLNNDNQLDIVVTNSGIHNIAIFIGDSNGTFVNQMTYSTGNSSQPLGVTIGDFNNDNCPDLAIANYGTTNLGVFFGNGNGFFMQQITFSVGDETNPIAVSIGDFDQDNLLDIIVLNIFPGNAIIFLSESACFQTQIVYSTGNGSKPHSVAVGDFNHDYYPDIVVANYATDNIALFFGYGNGTFESPIIYSTGFGSHPHSITVGDINNDTNLDLIVTTVGSDSISLLFGYANGTFSTIATLSTDVASMPRSVAIADFNNDNCSDIAVANYGSNNMVIFLGSGNGTFIKDKSHPFGYASRPYAIATGDFNNDSWIDIVVTEDGTGFVDILLQTCLK